MKQLKLSIFFLLLSFNSLSAIDYTDVNETREFIEMMNKKFNYKKEYLYKLFKQVRENPQSHYKKTKKIVKPLSEEYRPQGSWDIFARVHLENNQTDLGVEFMAEHKETLKKAYEEYGVPAEYITAIIGIESHYGKNRGTYYVFDSLTHLSFGDHKRKKFYQYQLQEFLLMCFREQVEPRAIKGSKSGAIGLAQFMPSNYKSLAVDFNNDGKIRISQPIDAIGSVANYLKENGWKNGEPVGTRVSYEGDRFYGLKTGYKHKYERQYLPNIYPKEGTFDYNKEVMLIKLEREKYDELWYGTHNFYVITRYNHSDYYAMAVHQLAEKIKIDYKKKYLHKKENTLYASNIK